MASKTKSTLRDRDSYMKMIHRFPLKRIRNENQHEQAVAVIGELIGGNLDSGAGDYLDALIVLVNNYEDEHHFPKAGQMSPQEALKAIMIANDMTQAQIGKIIGSESAVSMVLKGQRELSKSHIRALVSRFRVDANLFL